MWKSWSRWWNRVRGGKSADGTSVVSPDCLGYSGSSGRGECPLVMGFDFGTSASKVVVQAPYLSDPPPVFVAHRSSGSATEPSWLWPSRLSVDSKGACSLNEAPGSKVERHLKIRLMDGAETCDGTVAEQERGALATAYFALTLRAARKWILENQADLLSSFETLQWSLNVGIPSGTTVNKAQELRFLHVAKAGWRLSLTDGAIRVSEARLALKRAKAASADTSGSSSAFGASQASVVARGGARQGLGEASVEIGLCPEVLAGALGYARGDERRDGLHLAIDVGASTVDTCMFVLREEDGEERWPLLEAEVGRLGTFELHQRRIAAVGEVDAAKAHQFEERYDPLDPMAVDPRIDYTMNPEQVALRKADNQADADLRKLVGGVIQKTVTQRDRLAPAFKRGGSLPILFMGGGSRSPFYRRFAEGWDQVLRSRLASGQQGTLVIDAPIPQVLDANTKDAGHRMTVAFGLSHPYVDLPRHKPPTAIPDIAVPEQAKPKGHFVSKEEV